MYCVPLQGGLLYLSFVGGEDVVSELRAPTLYQVLKNIPTTSDVHQQCEKLCWCAQVGTKYKNRTILVAAISMSTFRHTPHKYVATGRSYYCRSDNRMRATTATAIVRRQKKSPPIT